MRERIIQKRRCFVTYIQIHTWWKNFFMSCVLFARSTDIDILIRWFSLCVRFHICILDTVWVFFFALCILFTLLIHIRGCARVRFCMRILYASYMYECDELKLIIHVLSSSSRNKCTHMWCVKKWNERARAYRKLQRCASSVVLNETERLFMAFYIHIVYVQQLLIYFKFTSSMCVCVCSACIDNRTSNAMLCLIV